MTDDQSGSTGDESEAERIAVSFPKGGTGKTFTAAHLAGGLSEYGFDVLAVDIDPQGTFTTNHNLGHLYEDEDQLSISETLADTDEWSRIDELIVERDDYDIIPSNTKLTDQKSKLNNSHQSDKRADHLMEVVDEDYDYIIFDCPPARNIYTKNAVYASKQVVIPNTPIEEVITSTERLFDFFEDMTELEEWDVTPLGGLLTDIPNGQLSAEHKEVIDWFDDVYGDNGFKLLKRAAFARATKEEGVTLHTHEESRQNDAFEPFDEFVQHVIERTYPDYLEAQAEAAAMGGGQA